MGVRGWGFQLSVISYQLSDVSFQFTDYCLLFTGRLRRAFGNTEKLLTPDSYLLFYFLLFTFSLKITVPTLDVNDIKWFADEPDKEFG